MLGSPSVRTACSPPRNATVALVQPAIANSRLPTRQPVRDSCETPASDIFDATACPASGSIDASIDTTRDSDKDENRKNDQDCIERPVGGRWNRNAENRFGSQTDSLTEDMGGVEVATQDTWGIGRHSKPPSLSPPCLHSTMLQHR